MKTLAAEYTELKRYLHYAGSLRSFYLISVTQAVSQRRVGSE